MRKTIFLIPVFFTLLITTSLKAQTGWFKLNTDTTVRYTSVFFTNTSTGYVSGYSGIILKTTDEGNSWTNLLSGTMRDLYSIKFTDLNTGYICGEFGTILKSMNGGINWELKNTGTSNHLRNLFFFNSSIGYCVGDAGTILETTNGGENWENVNIITFQNLWTVYFIDNSTGYVSGQNQAFFKTTNSGNNWQFQSTNYVTLAYSIYFSDFNTGIIAGEGGMDRTTNGGINWNYLYGGAYIFYSIKFVNTTNAYVVGHVYILKTTNSGANWITQFTSIAHWFLDVYFVNPNTGYCVGWTNYGTNTNGCVYKTTTGGNPIGIEPVSNNIPAYFVLNQNYPNPFNPSTTIVFDIPKTSFAKLIIYDVTGREIKTLVNEELKTGRYSVNFDGSSFNSGVYFYRLEADEFTEAKRMVLLK